MSATLDLWTGLNTEILIFLVTLAFALAIRGVSRRPLGERPSKGRRQGAKQAGGAPEAWPEPPRRWQPGARREACGTRQVVDSASRDVTGAGGSWKAQGRHPGHIVDEIVQSTRDQPGAKSAAKALELYAKLQRDLSADGGICITEAARHSRHTPIDVYTTLVQCVVRAGRCHLVERIIEDMVQQGVSRPLVFYESAMKQLAGQKQHGLALNIYHRLVADGLEPSAVTYSCLINFAAEIGEFERAAAFFQKLASLTTPSIRAYMTMLRVYGRQGNWQASVATFRDMQRRGVEIDSLVLNIILSTGISMNQVQQVEELISEADSFERPVTDVVSYNTLIKGYVQQNDFAAAAKVLERMRQRGLKPNAITFNSAMDAAVRGLRAAEAWGLLQEMRRAGLRPDKYTCSILVKGLARSPSLVHVQGALELLREVDALLDKALRSTLYRTVAEAAAQVGEPATLARAFAQMRQQQVAPSATMQKRLREFMEAQAAPGAGTAKVR
mmetsp:Transcript_69322/g.224092  ORF Transcript_69322/g.224092 Transcript_69322/m.224092 type:complete len:499 (+) Transcript_69322:158-1654(+)